MYKLLTVAVLSPILYSLLNYSVSAAGIKYLMSSTVKRYFLAPTTYLIFFVMLLIISMFSLVNISGLIYAMEASHREEKTNPLTLLLKGLGNALRVLNLKNIGAVIYVLFILPFTYTTMLSGTVLINRTPEFIKPFLAQNLTVVIIIAVVYVVLSLVAMNRIFSLNYFAIYKMSYKKALDYSKNIVRKNRGRVILGVVVWNIVFMILLLLFGSVLSTVFAVLIRSFVSWRKAQFAISMAFNVIFLLIYLVLSVISTPIIYSYVCSCFYRIDGDEICEEFNEVKERRHRELTKKQIKIRNNVCMVILLIISLVMDATYIYLSVNDRIDLNILYPTRASITAHRGDSAHAPENTLPAFILACENQADMIELDVRQTSDGEYVIMHDESLERTTGDTHMVGEVSLEYIKTLDAGSSFSDDFAGVVVPTLREVMEFASENDVFLNIELKDADTNSDSYVQGIVDMIHEYDYVDNCMLAAVSYDLLKEVKALDEDITTLYILKFAFNNIGSMEYVDAFSVRYNFVSTDLVKDIHKNGKKIYAWTVDGETQIKKLLLYDVDGIITNDPYNSKDIVYNANNSIVVDLLTRITESGF
jgi:glycerophosphoryl diester phosphodiesterase